MSSQCTELLAYLKKHHSITTLGAMEKLRILRLSERVRDLEASGVKIVRRKITAINRHGHPCTYVAYSLA